MIEDMTDDQIQEEIFNICTDISDICDGKHKGIALLAIAKLTGAYIAEGAKDTEDLSNRTSLFVTRLLESSKREFFDPSAFDKKND